MTFWAPGECKKVRANYVPQKKPKYAPKNCHRCLDCGAIVRNGTACKCFDRRLSQELQDQKVRDCTSVFIPTKNLVGKKNLKENKKK